MTRPLTILFSGMIAADPHQGGATWAVLQYLLGLRRLGHTVYFVEPIDRRKLLPAAWGLTETANAAYFQQIVEQFGFVEHSALLLAGTQETFGLPYASLLDVKPDVLINVSGMLADPSLIQRIPTRVYLDLDPAFVQLWHAGGVDMRFDAHTHFVTVGRGIGTDACRIPTCGRQWIGTAQPVVLDEWPVAGARVVDAFTTVGSWRGYGSIEHRGVHYGQKCHSLRKLIDLPIRTRERFLLAMAIHPDESKDIEALARNQWQVIAPADVAASPDEYRRFVQGSKGEIGIAKGGYVASHCQWFSDRSAVYLASGRPVIAQNTGFDRWLPTGRGLFSFDDVEQALAAIDAINTDYAGHCEAAREIAETYFDSDKVLTRLLCEVGVA